VVKTAAQATIDYAASTLNMANELSSHRADPSKISALGGYCLYYCVCVQQKYLLTQTDPRRPWESTSGALSILNTLQDYWFSIRQFVSRRPVFGAGY
jgi:hypothetical protein